MVALSRREITSPSMLLHLRKVHIPHTKTKYEIGDIAGAGNTLPIWQQRRYWYSGPPHRFAQSVASLGGSTAIFSLDLALPSLGYLWDHQVSVHLLSSCVNEFQICIICPEARVARHY
jgi:hypothetical protein